MSREIESGPRRDKHHIAAIAHLFLGETGNRVSGTADPCAVSCAAAGRASAPQGELFFTVASAADDHRAAVTSAALAQRTGSGAGVPPSGNRRDDTAMRINWFNLGPARAALLAKLAVERSVATLRHGADALPEARDGLIWCVGRVAATSLTAAYRLGRLAEFCAPRRVIVVVFPTPAGPGRTAAVAAEDRCAGEAGPRRCEALLRTALPRIPFEAVWLRRCDAVAVPAARGDPGPRFDRVAAALFAPCAG